MSVPLILPKEWSLDPPREVLNHSSLNMQTLLPPSRSASMLCQTSFPIESVFLLRPFIGWCWPACGPVLYFCPVFSSCSAEGRLQFFLSFSLDPSLSLPRTLSLLFFYSGALDKLKNNILCLQIPSCIQKQSPMTQSLRKHQLPSTAQLPTLWQVCGLESYLMVHPCMSVSHQRPPTYCLSTLMPGPTWLPTWPRGDYLRSQTWIWCRLCSGHEVLLFGTFYPL